jgi:hypothetical protein
LTILHGKSPSHLLIYTNEIKDAELVKNYIKEILSYGIIDINPNDLYYNSLHSQLDNKIIEEGLEEFKKKKYGIISCVQLFGEGINCPIIDGITIACNMISEIKIFKYLLRANRLYKGNPDKIAYYIIPYLSNEKYMNIRHIIKQLANYDKNIEQKIMVTEVSYTCSSLPNAKPVYEFIDNPELLLKIKMKLRNSKDLICDFTEEENEYNYVKTINKCLNLNSRKDYLNSKEIHENFIENPDKYFLEKGVWVNWCDYLGYDTNKFIQTKQNWVKFCREKEINSIDDYNKFSATMSPQDAKELAIWSKMKKIRKNLPLIPVDSAFGGLGIYRKSVFMNHNYSLPLKQHHESEHVSLHKKIIDSNGLLFIAPKMTNFSWGAHNLSSFKLLRKLDQASNRKGFRIIRSFARKLLS